ncbi:MAG: helix-turn-helix transcriptional regulator [Alistipes sp.]|nr:helix-turn-helix transcriptional regulator [Alistipes sp.]
MATKIKAIIEKGEDGLFSAYSDFELNDYTFAGFGDSATKAKEDFLASIREAIEMLEQDGIASYDEADFIVEWKYDIPSLFGCFEYLNISKFAMEAGVNPSQMRKYARGLAYPSEKTVEKIAKTISDISSELSMVRV